MHKLSIGVFFVTVMIVCYLHAEPPKGDLEEISTSIYLPAGRTIASPDGKLQCFTRNLTSGQRLYLQRGKEKELLHTTGRNLGVIWASNSKWLAVTDNDAAGENYIIVFDVTGKAPVLVAKTPQVPGQAWTIQKWDIPNKKLVVRSGGDRDSRIAPYSLSLELSK
jgi:Tol biopolymer transport system component